MRSSVPPERVVVALGGNALEGDPGDVRAQAAAARRALASLDDILQAPHLLLSHGNGPQVGALLLRGEAVVEGQSLPALPLDICVADTIGGLGYMIGRELRGALAASGLQRSVAALVTTTVVGPPGPAPRKAIGPAWASSEEARLRARGWELREDRRGGLRRLVASPTPIRVLEIDVIRHLFEIGVVLVAGGGGGVPVIETEGGAFVGVEAVVDKDLVAAYIATQVDANLLMILTDIENAYMHYGSDAQAPIEDIEVRELRALLEEGAFGEGSMAPKVEAACRFVETAGGRSVICHLGQARAGAAGTAGTQVHAAQ